MTGERKAYMHGVTLDDIQRWSIHPRSGAVVFQAQCVTTALEELTYDEIASILHVSRRTVERHLPRAKVKFCQAYEREHTHAVPARRTALDTPTYTGLIPLVPDIRPS
jgi:DNA-binding transcriptional ArsR family regulator